jgi:protein disulfide-isomerase A6
VVEFYAPWCGHCQNLKPAYEKAAKNLQGLAKVAAVNCDDDANKPLCGSLGIQGFPTLKIVRPGKKGGRPVVEDYQGPRTATGIVEAVIDKITNHVVRVTDKEMDKFLDEKNQTTKAILFTEKGTTSALLRAIAIDFLGTITVAQVRSNQAQAVELFGITKFPTLVLLPGGDTDGMVFEGEMKKDAMVEFLAQAGGPNPDYTGKAAPAKEEKKDKKEKKEKKEEKKKAEKKDEPAAEEEETTAAPPPPPPKPSHPPIPTLMFTEELAKKCLMPKSGTCVLAFVPEEKNEVADKALETLAELVHNNVKAGSHLFPFYTIPGVNPSHKTTREKLELSGDVEIVAINAKRGWWRHYEGELDLMGLEAWVDAIRMSEGAKKKLPDGIVLEAEKPAEKAGESADEKSGEPVAETEKAQTKTDKAAEKSEEANKEVHDEL